MRTLQAVEPIQGGEVAETLTLAFEQRVKSRLRTRLDSGEEVAILLARGRVLRSGDLLVADDGRVVRVLARAELVSTVRCEDACALARAAYHLGNRHVAVEVGPNFLRYQHDHVLDDMVRALGLSVAAEHSPFEPEAGAYGGGHNHAHSHAHADEHGADPARVHGHEHPHPRHGAPAGGRLG